MVTLSQFIKDTGTTQAAIARDVGVSQAYIAKLCRSGVPSLPVAVAIERATRGAVPVASWVRREVSE